MTTLFDFSNILRVLRQPNYGLYAAGNIISLIGFWMRKVGVGWLTWELTGSGAWLGIIAFADMFPVVVFAPLAGAITDRWDATKVIKLAQVLIIAHGLALFYLTAGGIITIEMLLMLEIALGVFAAFDQPARLALIPLLVGRRDLSAAVAIGSVSFNSAQFIGPAVAGAMILVFGVASTFAANAAAYGLFLAVMFRVRVIAGEREGPAPERSILGGLADGIRYAANHPGISSALLTITAIALFARPFFELFPGFADVVFEAGPKGLAVLTSSAGAGAVICGLWLAQRGDPAGLSRIIERSFLIVSLAIAVFLSTDLLWVAAAAVVVIGFCISSIGVGTQILLQVAVDAEMRGRVMSLYVVLFRAVPAFGALIMGLASESFGLRAPVAVGAVLTFGVFVWVRLRRRGEGPRS
jgi:predicted MFS family arabinose efflux permease